VPVPANLEPRGWASLTPAPKVSLQDGPILGEVAVVTESRQAAECDPPATMTAWVRFTCQTLPNIVLKDFGKLAGPAEELTTLRYEQTPRPEAGPISAHENPPLPSRTDMRYHSQGHAVPAAKPRQEKQFDRPATHATVHTTSLPRGIVSGG
jgi:hypothetical protein